MSGVGTHLWLCLYPRLLHLLIFKLTQLANQQYNKQGGSLAMCCTPMDSSCKRSMTTLHAAPACNVTRHNHNTLLTFLVLKVRGLTFLNNLWANSDWDDDVLKLTQEL